MVSKVLTKYPVLYKTIANIIHRIILGLFNNEPVHIGIDNPCFIQKYDSYKLKSLEFWESHLSAYQVIHGSAAISSIVIKLEHKLKRDIFEAGTYFYNCNSGSFQIEVNSKGKMSEIIAEFNGNTTSPIIDLLDDFPGEAYPDKVELVKDINRACIVNDDIFLAGLQPVPFKIIEID
jgi:hypothetical protein